MPKSHSDPIALFTAAAVLTRAGDYLAAARLCDPVSLRAFKRGMIRQYATVWPAPRPLRPEDFTRSAPDMPPEVVQYYVEQHKRRAIVERDVSHELPMIASNAALAAAEPDVVFAAYLDGRSWPRQLERQVAAGHLSAEMWEGQAKNPFPIPSPVPIGFVDVGNGTGLVVCVLEKVIDNTPLTPRAQRELEAFTASIGVIPEDEQLLQSQREGMFNPQCCIVRRQDDGGWLMLADHSFFCAPFGAVMFGTEIDQDDAESSDAPDGQGAS
jgi:hypothetical protein